MVNYASTVTAIANKKQSNNQAAAMAVLKTAAGRNSSDIGKHCGRK